ncbi:MAG TPA: DNA-processing protein DprA [Bacteroidales bacterium]|nr:DNA-processing protein DprA [Bacteroidales bacterium]
MTEPSLVHRIALGMIPGVGDITARKLVSHAGSVEAVFSESHRTLTRIPGVGDSLAKAISGHVYLETAKREAEFVEKHNIKVYFYLDDDYPYRLRQCDDSPVTFYYKGNADLNAAQMLSVVGTRNATQHGREICQKIIAGLALHFPGLVVVSGLAYGIDITAHKAAMANSLPTVAVLGHGLKTIYPSLHRSVARNMLTNGGLVTDFSSETLPERNNFIRRNRIIAGISDATLIIESGIKGGALITADIAASYNHDVMAIPGRTNDQWSAGCNALIKCNKASLVEKYEDIEYLLGWKPATLTAPIQKVIFAEMTENEKKVFEALKENGDMTLDQLALSLGIPSYRLSTTLLQMELAGLITPCPGSIYRIRG